MPSPIPSKQVSRLNGDSAGGGSFDFEQFNKSLGEQSRVTAARQAEELATSKAQNAIRQRSAALAKEQDNAMGFLLKSVQESQAKAAAARQLADSNNPLDTLRLLGLQQMDPAGFRRDVREARLQEDTQQAVILNRLFAGKQEALQAEMNATTGKLDQLKILESIGNEKLTLYARNAELMKNHIAGVQSMKQDAIMGLSDSEISLAIAQAKGSSTGTTNIAGVDVDVRTLEDRKMALDERRFLQLTKDTARKLAEDENIHVEETLAARETQRTIDRQNQLHTLSTQPTEQALHRAELTQRSQTVIRQAQQRELGYMTETEISQIRNNNYKSPAGEQYQAADVEQAYELRKQAQTQSIQDELLRNAVNNFDTAEMAKEKQRVDSIAARFPANSPLQKSARKYQTALGIAAISSGEQQPMFTRIAAQQGYEAARQEFDKALLAQATLDSKGDKDMQDMLLAFYQGMPIPQDSLANAVSTRLKKSKSVADIFPPQIAKAVERRYRDLLQESLAFNPARIGAMTAEERRLIEEESAQQAIQFGLNNGLNGTTDAYLTNQVLVPGHPFNGKKSPAQMGSLYARADGLAMAEWQQMNQLSEEEVKQVLAGVQPAGKSLDSLQTGLELLRSSKLLSILEAEDPGSGKALSEWWLQHGTEFVTQQTAALAGQAGSTFQGQNFYSSASDMVVDQFMKYSLVMSQADESLRAEISSRNADMLAFDSNPESAQVAILSYDKNLTDAEREQIYTQVIRPLVDAAAKQNLSFEDTNRFVEAGIQNFQPQTPEMKALMKTVKRDRAEVLESMNSWKSLFRSFVPFMGDSNEKTKWFREWKAKNNQDGRIPGTRDMNIGGIRVRQPGTTKSSDDYIEPATADNFITIGDVGKMIFGE